MQDLFLSKEAINIFNLSIKDYHKENKITTPISNPFPKENVNHLLYQKNWVDTVQWHYEDIIRDPNIDPVEGMNLKRKIDLSNQNRTDLVELIDDWFWNVFEGKAQKQAKINTETPAWVLDRLSILCLKIWHMEEQTLRKDIDENAVNSAKNKLDTLLLQQKDLSTSFDEFIINLKTGKMKMKLYRQMKMYNDPLTNPFLKKNK